MVGAALERVFCGKRMWNDGSREDGEVRGEYIERQEMMLELELAASESRGM